MKEFKTINYDKSGNKIEYKNCMKIYELESSDDKEKILKKILKNERENNN